VSPASGFLLGASMTRLQAVRSGAWTARRRSVGQPGDSWRATPCRVRLAVKAGAGSPEQDCPFASRWPAQIRSSGQGTRWHQAACERWARTHRSPHRAPQRRAPDRSHGLESSTSAAWPGSSAGIAVVDVEAMPSLALRDRPQGSHGSRCRERPTDAGGPPFTQRGVSRAAWDPAALPTDPTKRVIQQR
jgi:hypothetical protein